MVWRRLWRWRMGSEAAGGARVGASPAGARARSRTAVPWSGLPQSWKNGSVALAFSGSGRRWRFMEAKWGPQRSRLLFRHALQVRARLSARRGDLEAARKDYGEVAAIREFLDPAP